VSGEVLFIGDHRDHDMRLLSAALESRGVSTEYLRMGLPQDEYVLDWHLEEGAGLVSARGVEVRSQDIARFKAVFCKSTILSDPAWVSVPSEGDAAAEAFGLREWIAALSAFFELLYTEALAVGVPWLNPPNASRLTNLKPYLLHVARTVGIAVPWTACTTAPLGERQPGKALVAKAINKLEYVTEDLQFQTTRLDEHQVSQVTALTAPTPSYLQALVLPATTNCGST